MLGSEGRSRNGLRIHGPEAVLSHPPSLRPSHAALGTIVADIVAIAALIATPPLRTTTRGTNVRIPCLIDACLFSPDRLGNVLRVLNLLLPETDLLAHDRCLFDP